MFILSYLLWFGFYLVLASSQLLHCACIHYLYVYFKHGTAFIAFSEPKTVHIVSISKIDSNSFNVWVFIILHVLLFDRFLSQGLAISIYLTWLKYLVKDFTGRYFGTKNKTIYSDLTTTVFTLCLLLYRYFWIRFANDYHLCLIWNHWFWY